MSKEKLTNDVENLEIIVDSLVQEVIYLASKIKKLKRELNNEKKNQKEE